MSETVVINQQPVNVTITEQPLTLALGSGGGGSGCCPTGSVSSDNSTIIALPGGGSFIGVGNDTSNWAAIEVTCFTDQNGTLQLEFSQDSTNWDTISSYVIQAGVPFSIQLVPTARYFRTVYTNGATPQTVFRLQSVYKQASGIPVGEPGQAGIDAVYVQGIAGGLPITVGGTVTTIPAGGGGTQTVFVTNFPATQTVAGTVTVAGGGSTTVSGTVAVSNFPATQTVIQAPASSVTIIPSGTQTVTGTVVVSGLGGTQTVIQAPASSITVVPSGTQTVAIAGGTGTTTVAGSVAVTNFPATQTVAGTVSVLGITGTQTVIQALGSSITVVPSGTQTVTGTVAILGGGGTTTVAGTVSTIPTGTTTVLPLGGTITYTTPLLGSFASATIIGPVQIDSYGVLEVNVNTAQNSGANGLALQFSLDGTTWSPPDEYYNYTVTAGTPLHIQLVPPASFFQILYTNASVAQTRFRVEVLLKNVASIPVATAGANSQSGFSQAALVQGTAGGTPIPVGGGTETVTIVPANNSVITTYALNTSTQTIANQYIAYTSTTPLAANGSVTQGATSILFQYSSIEVSVDTDQTGTLSIQFGTNGLSPLDNVYNYPIAASTPFFVQLIPPSQWFQVVYTNGATPQTLFKLQTVLKASAAIPAANAGANAIQAVAVQGVTNGVPQPVSGTVTGLPSGTQTISGNVNVVGTSTVIQAANSTITNIGSSIAIVGRPGFTANQAQNLVPQTYVAPYSVVEITIDTDQNSATSTVGGTYGLFVQFGQSTTLANTEQTYLYNIVGNQPFYAQIAVPNEYMWIWYTNGSVATTRFNFSVVLKTTSSNPAGNAGQVAANPQQAAFIQGVPGGTPVPVSGTVTGLPAGTQTVAGSIAINPGQTVTVMSGSFSNNVFPTSWYASPGAFITPMSTAFTGTSTANGAVTITLAAMAAQYGVITGIAWSYAGGTPTGSVIIQAGGTTMFQIDISNNGPGYIPFVPPLRTTITNQAITATLTAGGVSVNGKINFLGAWNAA